MEAEALGLPPAFIAKQKAKAASNEFELWQEHIQVYELFTQLFTQWNKTASMGGVWFDGLNYQAIESVLRLNLIPEPKHPQLFNELRLIERGALEILNAR